MYQKQSAESHLSELDLHSRKKRDREQDLDQALGRYSENNKMLALIFDGTGIEDTHTGTLASGGHRNVLLHLWILANMTRRRR